MADPSSFENVSLLVRFDGSDGATTFVDESSFAHTITAFGDAQIDTAQSKFGGSSLLLDGTGDWAKIASSAAFGLGTGFWTVEAWVRRASAFTSKVVIDFRAADTDHAYFQVDPNGFLSYYGGGTFIAPVSTVVPADTWTHVAWSWDGTTLRAFVGGVLAWTDTTISPNFGSAKGATIGATYSGNNRYSGHIDSIRVTKGEALYTAAFTPPTAEFPLADAVEGILSDAGLPRPPSAIGAVVVLGSASAASPIGSPTILSVLQFGRIAAGSPLGAPPHLLAWHDFTGRLSTTAPIRYVMDLVTPGGLVRVPISTWQATLQTGNASYAQCTVPAATDWAESIQVATEFVISRVGRLDDGSAVEYEMVRAPLQSVSDSQGPRNRTASLSGYFDALPDAVEDPPAAYDRQLQGVRSVSLQSTGTTRVRCAIDWLLRPGHRAYNGPDPIIVEYVNWYVTSAGDQYMDVGDRAT